MVSSAYTTLIGTAELAAHGADLRWVIVDCRFNLADIQAGERAYRGAHLPGAHYAHLDRHLSSAITSRTGRHPLPDVEVLARTLGQWGIDATSQVVVYDDCGGAMAVRLWWLLRWLGHPNVALLDGGIGQWRSEGRPTSTALPRVGHGGFQPRCDDTQWLSTRAIERGLAAQTILLVDARSAVRFRGDEEPIDPVAGHIPCAVNFPLQDNLASDGTFLPSERLREKYLALLDGREPAAVVHMCGSGVTACHNLLAMEVAGLNGSKLYPGSWSEWILDPRRPVATHAVSAE